MREISTMNRERTSLKGKRKKIIPKNANPLFTQWLSEWRDEAAEKGWKSYHTFSKALKTLKLFPLTLRSGKDCKLLQNFGDKICKMLDEKLAKHEQINGKVDYSNEYVCLDGTTKKDADTVIPQKVSHSTTHQISDNSDSDTERFPSPQKKKRQVTKSKAREYVPAFRSGPYALILTLHKFSQDPDFRGYMTKGELCSAAQPLCEKSFTRPDPGSHYTAWSSMSTVIKKGFIQKDGCPARYTLTDSGCELGQRLENADKGKPVEPEYLQPEPSCTRDSNANLPESYTEKSCQFENQIHKTDHTQKHGPPELHIVLSDSDDDIESDKIHHNEKNAHTSAPPTVDIDDDVFILSDDDDKCLNTGNEKYPSSPRHQRVHSISPSSSSSSLPDSFNLKPVPSSDNNNEFIDICDDDVIDVAIDERYSNRILNFQSEDGVRNFALECQDKQKDTPKFDDDDDDELPDLDFIPLSKRLMKKGFSSSCLLNSQKPFNNVSTSTHDTLLNSIEIDDRLPKIKSDSKSKASSNMSSYTSLQEKNPKAHCSSSTTHSSSSTFLKQSSVPHHSCQPPSETLPYALTEVIQSPSVAFSLLPGTFDIILCVDQREFYGSTSSSKTLLPDLIKTGINCDLRHLNISDLLWVAREKTSSVQPLGSCKGRELVLNYAVERKRMDDLVSSISSGRLREQKFRLKHSGISELIILIEEYGSIQNFSLSEDRIKQTIVNSQILDGFKIKRCGSSQEAVTYLAIMTRFLQSHFHSKTLHAVSHDWLKDNKKYSLNDLEHYLMPFEIFNEASVKQKVLSMREMFAKHLLQIPGISLDRANAITKVYPTLSRLLEAYENCDSEKAKESLLASIKCGNKERNLGIAVSRIVKMLYNATEVLS